MFFVDRVINVVRLITTRHGSITSLHR